MQFNEKQWKHPLSCEILKVKVQRSIAKRCHGTLCVSLFWVGLCSPYWLTIKASGLSYAVQSSPLRPNQVYLTTDWVSAGINHVYTFSLRWKTPVLPDKRISHLISSDHSFWTYLLALLSFFLFIIYISKCVCFPGTDSLCWEQELYGAWSASPGGLLSVHKLLCCSQIPPHCRVWQSGPCLEETSSVSTEQFNGKINIMSRYTCNRFSPLINKMQMCRRKEKQFEFLFDLHTLNLERRKFILPAHYAVLCCVAHFCSSLRHQYAPFIYLSKAQLAWLSFVYSK